MKRSKITIYSVLLAGALLLSGCGRQSSAIIITERPGSSEVYPSASPAVQTDRIAGQDYLSGSPLKLLEAPDLTITEYASRDEDGDYYRNAYYVYSLVDGLKNTAIQDAVNSRISSAAAAWCEKRPALSDGAFMGLSSDIRKNACYGFISKVCFCSNDFLCFDVERSVDCYDPQTTTHTLFTYPSPINFDIRTGEEFSFRALFAQDYDPIPVINRAITDYGKEAGLSMINFGGIETVDTFTLSDNGLIIYLDESAGQSGLKQGTAVTIPYGNFEDGWAISRECNNNLYTSEEKPRYILLGRTGDAADAEEIIYDKKNLCVTVRTHCPAAMDPALFGQAKSTAASYYPTNQDIKNAAEDKVALNYTFDISGGILGDYYCVILNGVLERSDAPVQNLTYYYTYNDQGQTVTAGSMFAEDYPAGDMISGKLAGILNSAMDQGWSIDGEVGLSDISCLIESRGLSFATLPIAMSRTITCSDGTQTEEKINDSLVIFVDFNEIGTENLTVFGQ